MRLEALISRAVAGLVAFAILTALGYFFAQTFITEVETRVEHLRIHPQIERRIR